MKIYIRPLLMGNLFQLQKYSYMDAGGRYLIIIIAYMMASPQILYYQIFGFNRILPKIFQHFNLIHCQFQTNIFDNFILNCIPILSNALLHVWMYMSSSKELSNQDFFRNLSICFKSEISIDLHDMIWIEGLCKLSKWVWIYNSNRKLATMYNDIQVTHFY